MIDTAALEGNIRALGDTMKEISVLALQSLASKRNVTGLFIDVSEYCAPADAAPGPAVMLHPVRGDLRDDYLTCGSWPEKNDRPFRDMIDSNLALRIDILASRAEREYGSILEMIRALETRLYLSFQGMADRDGFLFDMVRVNGLPFARSAPVATTAAVVAPALAECAKLLSLTPGPRERIDCFRFKRSLPSGTDQAILNDTALSLLARTPAAWAPSEQTARGLIDYAIHCNQALGTAIPEARGNTDFMTVPEPQTIDF